MKHETIDLLDDSSDEEEQTELKIAGGTKNHNESLNDNDDDEEEIEFLGTKPSSKAKPSNQVNREQLCKIVVGASVQQPASRATGALPIEELRNKRLAALAGGPSYHSSPLENTNVADANSHVKKEKEEEHAKDPFGPLKDQESTTVAGSKPGRFCTYARMPL